MPVGEASRSLDPLSITKLLAQAPGHAGSAAEPGTKGAPQALGVQRESQGPSARTARTPPVVVTRHVG